MSKENSSSPSPEWQEYADAIPSLQFVATPSQHSDRQIASQSLTPTFRSEIDQLLAIHRLGKIRKEYKNEISKALAVGLSSCMIGILFLILLFLAFSDQTGYLGGMRATFFIGFGFLAYGINRITVVMNRMGSNVRFQNPRNFLCSYGLMSIKGKQVQAIRWDNIEVVQKYPLTDISDVPQQYVLYPKSEEEPIVLDNTFVGFGIFGKQIEQEVKALLLPKAITACKSDQTLNFGAVNVTPNGLLLEETQENLPWEKLGSIDERKGNLFIKERGTLALWKKIEVSSLLNLCVLLPLIQQTKMNKRMTENEPRNLSYQPPINDVQQSEWGEYE